jgi:hypothetical protein
LVQVLRQGSVRIVPRPEVMELAANLHAHTPAACAEESRCTAWQACFGCRQV